MAIWNTDLTTEDGALGAAQMGAYACFIAAVLSGITTAMAFGFVLNWTGDARLTAAVAMGLFEVAVFLVAGFRLRAGKGMGWGIGAALLLTIELLVKLAMLALSIALVINVLLLIFTVNGIRGANALRKGIADPDETAEIFS